MEDLSSLIESIIPSVVQIVTPQSQGTGFWIREDGIIITNKHVVGRNTFVKLKTSEQTEYDAQVFAGNVPQDYAFLVTNAPCKKILKFVNSDEVKIAEPVIAIGHPYGYSFTVNDGIISSIARENVVPGLKSVGFLQLDLEINPGNSGGPLIRPNGEVIGMITMAVLKAQSIAFAIPSNYLIQAYQPFVDKTIQDLLTGIYCVLCGNLNSADQEYCQKCGTKISKPKIPAGFGDVLKPPVFAADQDSIQGPTISCRVCGSINSAAESYCLKCGAKLPEAQVKISSETKILSSPAKSKKEIECPICHTLNHDCLYCLKCGKKLL